MTKPHPCLRCGACCAYFRVSFYWRESLPSEHEHAVPAHLTEKLNDTCQVMRGTEAKHQRACIALRGRIGDRVSCTIYTNRPSPCRQFAASFENGTKNPRCDEARAHHGLPPLTKASFEGNSV